MARCGLDDCGRWRPDWLARSGRAGLWFEDVWYCGLECVEAIVRVRLENVETARGPIVTSVARARLGSLMLHQQAITVERLHIALRRQRQTGLRLGEQLLGLGFATAHDVLKALAAQAGVGYLTALDPRLVESGPGNLSREAVERLGLVPFEADPSGPRLKVACRAPLPRAALKALRQVTGWTVDAYLVTDENWQRLAAAYRRSNTTPAREGGVWTLGDAALRVARAAQSGQAERMAHARCAPYLWVRVEGKGASEDLVVSMPDLLEERTWQAAPTRH